MAGLKKVRAKEASASKRFSQNNHEQWPHPSKLQHQRHCVNMTRIMILATKELQVIMYRILLLKRAVR